jgi:hypothetical protein
MTDLAALREHIFRVEAGTAADERRRSHWVMDPRWLRVLRMLDDGSGFWLEVPGGPQHILGLPLQLRDGAGLPHLEP